MHRDGLGYGLDAMEARVNVAAAYCPSRGAAMESVSLRVHQGSEDADSEDSSKGEAADHSALTWPAQAADLLLYTLTNDPSIRARRAAMKTLKAAQVHCPHTFRCILAVLRV